MGKHLLFIFAGIFLLWLAWTQVLTPIRGSAETEMMAAAAAEAAEQELEAARELQDDQLAEVLRRQEETNQLAEFALTLPEINVGRPDGALSRWFGKFITTPQEFRASSATTAKETLPSSSESLYWTNNNTCTGGTVSDATEEGASSGVSSTSDFSFSACQELVEPTIIIGSVPVEVGLGDFNGDCRAAAGWLFSRFFEPRIDSEGVAHPSNNLRSWILPGSFQASFQWCGNEAGRRELAEQIGIEYGSYPTGLENPDGDSTPNNNVDDYAEQLSVQVSFTLLYRPIAPELCVPNLIGYAETAGIPQTEGEPADWLACPTRRTIAFDEADEEPFRRECFPRLPFSTLIEDGDLTTARFLGEDPATGQWPSSLNECFILLKPPSNGGNEIDDDLDGVNVLGETEDTGGDTFNISPGS